VLVCSPPSRSLVKSPFAIPNRIPTFSDSAIPSAQDGEISNVFLGKLFLRGVERSALIITGLRE
jgi:hypothetical protein